MRDIDGHVVEHDYILLDCGEMAEFDDGSGCSYRCMTCGATIGSIAEPAACRTIRQEKEDKVKVWKVLST